MDRQLLFCVIFTVSASFLYSSQLHISSQDYELSYLKKWRLKTVSLEKHIEEGEKITFVGEDEPAGGTAVIGVGKKVLLYNKDSNIVKPYQFNFSVLSAFFDLNRLSLFVFGYHPEEPQWRSMVRYDGHTKTLVDVGSRLIDFTGLASAHFTFGPMQDGMLVISSKNMSLLYDVDKNRVRDCKTHEPFVKDGVKLLKSLKPGLVRTESGDRLNPHYFMSKEGVVCAHSTDNTYPYICERRLGKYAPYSIAVTKRIIRGKEIIQGTRSIGVAGKLAAILRSPINPEMFMLAYKDQGKGVELQHVEGPSLSVRTYSNIHGPFTFSADGTTFMGFNRQKLILLTIAEQIVSRHQTNSNSALIAQRALATEAEVEFYETWGQYMNSIAEQGSEQQALLEYAKEKHPSMFLKDGEVVPKEKKVIPKKKKKTGNRKKKKKKR